MRLVAIGRLRSGPEAALIERYAKRLRPALAIVELADGTGSAVEIKRREGEALLGAIPGGAFVVALDQDGEALDSVALAARLSGWMERRGGPCFVIGGAEGLDAAVIARADAAVSLGRLTWPHALARVMLVEQLYRAQAIAGGHPYHRDGRP